MEGRRRSPQAPHLTASVDISEPELDMCRDSGVQPRPLARWLDPIRKLISDSRKTVLPMRSIARELEESWPTGES